ncbi:hypothetical protein ACB092_01G294600 [Castanea dentata]
MAEKKREERFVLCRQRWRICGVGKSRRRLVGFVGYFVFSMRRIVVVLRFASCMIFLHPTSEAKLVMKKWIEELHVQPWSKAKKSNDQPAFNWALNKTAGEEDYTSRT